MSVRPVDPEQNETIVYGHGHGHACDPEKIDSCTYVAARGLALATTRLTCA
jgi:hypothetical protein